MSYKVLFLSSWYPTKVEPTNGNFVQRHAEAVALENHVDIIHAIGVDRQRETYVIDDQVCNRIRTIIVYYQNTRNPFLNFYRRMKAHAMAFALIERPDIVHANVLHNTMLFAVFLRWKYQLPYVVTEHWTLFQFQNHKKITFTQKKVAQFIARFASYILPVSENLKKSLQKLDIQAPMKVISNVVDTDVFSPSKNRKGDGVCTFVHISSLIPRKNPDKIIDAVVKLANEGLQVRLLIGGDGDYQRLQKLVREYNAEEYIQVFGSLTYEEVAEKMNISDCFVLYSDNETQGCVLLESYACGIPVIATSVGGVPEFVSLEKGVLIEAQNDEGLYLAMKKMLESKGNYDPQRLRNYVMDTFSKESICRQFTKLYSEALKR